MIRDANAARSTGGRAWRPPSEPPDPETMPEETAQGPLVGYRALELGTMVAGPFVGRLLADFGAEVLKVEQAEGDPVRDYGRRFEGKSLYAASIMRNKRNISVNLREAAGRDLVRRMIPQCDFMIENFRPGTLERWGLGYEDVRAVNPGIIVVRVSGFGQTGPYGGRAGYGVVAEAVSGLRHITGDPDRPPSRVAVPLTDYIGGLFAVCGALAALTHRQKTGEGQCVDAALYESAFSVTEPFVPQYGKTGEAGMRAGPRLPGNAPNSLYRARDGLYVQVTAGNDRIFRRLAEVMGRPELAEDGRFATHADRWRHVDALDGIIGAWAAGIDSGELEGRLNEAGVPSARIYTMAEIYEDPHFAARDMLVDAPSSELGAVTLAGVVPRLSATPGGVRWAGRKPGQDTRAVLRELCGLDDAELSRLEAEGIIHCEDDAEAAAAAE